MVHREAVEAKDSKLSSVWSNTLKSHLIASWLQQVTTDAAKSPLNDMKPVWQSIMLSSSSKIGPIIRVDRTVSGLSIPAAFLIHFILHTVLFSSLFSPSLLWELLFLGPFCFKFFLLLIIFELVCFYLKNEFQTMVTVQFISKQIL